MSSPYPSYYIDYAITGIVCKAMLLTGGNTKLHFYKYI